jgi:hypothetical protein
MGDGHREVTALVLDLDVLVLVRILVGNVVITGTVVEAKEVDAVAPFTIIVGVIVLAEAIEAVALLTVVDVEARVVGAVLAALELGAT